MIAIVVFFSHYSVEKHDSTDIISNWVSLQLYRSERERDRDRDRDIERQ